MPESFDSLLAGTDDYGFAHGVAAFLLTVGSRLARAESPTCSRGGHDGD